MQLETVRYLVPCAGNSTVLYFQEGHGGAACSGEAWPFRGIMAARKQVRCGPDIYSHHLPAARVGVVAH